MPAMKPTMAMATTLRIGVKRDLAVCGLRGGRNGSTSRGGPYSRSGKRSTGDGSRAGLSSLMAQRVDGLQERGAVGGVDAEHQPRCDRYREPQGDGIGLEDGLESGDRELRPCDADQHARDPSQPREDDRLEDELADYVRTAGAARLSGADLPGAFGHRDEHDVYDADPPPPPREGGPPPPQEGG